MAKLLRPEDTIKEEKKEKETKFCSECGSKVCKECGKANCEC